MVHPPPKTYLLDYMGFESQSKKNSTWELKPMCFKGSCCALCCYGRGFQFGYQVSPPAGICRIIHLQSSLYCGSMDL